MPNQVGEAKRHGKVIIVSTSVHFLNVQQGNMVLVRCDDGTNIVVDCNINNDNKRSVISYLREAYVDSINVFCATHRDVDHITGVKYLAQLFSVQQMWDSGYRRDTEHDLPDAYREYQHLWSAHARYGTARIIRAGGTFRHGSTLITCLSANDQSKPDTVNDRGLVLEISDGYAWGSILLTGDISRTGWHKGKLTERVKGKVGVLMASHHGSNSFFEDEQNGFDAAHLRAMKPDHTIISVGKNPHEHPDRRALNAYQQHSGRVLRTDQEGHISAYSLNDGSPWLVSPGESRVVFHH